MHALTIEPRPTPTPRRSVVVIVVVGALLCAIFIALGTWQIVRRSWKLDLIERVEQRVHAAASEAPAFEQWPAVTAANDEYRHVRVSGVLLSDKEARVQAVTELGSGFWVITPLRLADGSIVMINRGFVSSSARSSAGTPADGGVGPDNSPITGLLRITEPGGGFLRSNNAAADRWYSRDTQAIGAARGLTRVAPWFVDQDASGSSTRSASAGSNGARSPDEPVGGLTVIAFHNNHLVYALTWYALAIMSAAGAWRFSRVPANEGGPRGAQD